MKVTSRTDEVHLEMEALPNVLRAVSHTYFGGRASLAFLTEEPLTVRIQNRDSSFNVVLAETAKGPELGDSLDGTVARVRRQQRPNYGYYVDHVIDVVGDVTDVDEPWPSVEFMNTSPLRRICM